MVRDLSCGEHDIHLELLVRRIACRSCGKVKRERLARLMDLALDLKKLALGLDSPNPLPDKITYELTNLKRAYGHRDGQSHSSENFPGTAAPPHGPCGSGRESAPASVPPLDPKPPVPALPPPETKRDITPVKLVVGPHGFLTYEYPKPASDHS